MPDTGDLEITHLQRRKIEGRVLMPFIETMREKFGADTAWEIVDATIQRLAAEDGACWAQTYGSGTGALQRVAEELWAGGGGMDIRVIDRSDDHLDFNVTRCRYAEFYQALGLAEIGYRFHCKRDHAMLASFNSELTLSRSQTIMEGAACCDFRFRKSEGIGSA
jgi:hypothetical protein